MAKEDNGWPSLKIKKKILIMEAVKLVRKIGPLMNSQVI